MTSRLIDMTLGQMSDICKARSSCYASSSEDGLTYDCPFTHICRNKGTYNPEDYRSILGNKEITMEV